MNPSLRNPPPAVSDADLADLAALLHHRWAIAILAALHEQRGAKFITLINRLTVSRDSLRRTLDALIEAGFVQRNPGYGHPMRPEYILTPRGGLLGEPCLRVAAELRDRAIEPIALRKWSLPVLLCIAAGHERFGEIDEALPAATPRAITEALKSLSAARLIERTIEPGYPPRPRYRNAPGVIPLLRPLADLAKAA